MSGGSLDYLYMKDASQILWEYEAMQRAIDTLTDLGHNQAAVAVETLLVFVKQYEQLAQNRMGEVEGILHAVEWFLSCDSGPDHVAEAVERWAVKYNIGDVCVCGAEKRIWQMIKETRGWRPYVYCPVCELSTFPIAEFFSTETQAQGVCDCLTTEGLRGYLDAARKSNSN